MALRESKILGPDGRPFMVKDDDEEIAGHGDGRALDPADPSVDRPVAAGMASILRAAEDGDAERYLALAEDLEEKYRTTPRCCRPASCGLQLEVKIDAATDDARDVDRRLRARLVRAARAGERAVRRARRHRQGLCRAGDPVEHRAHALVPRELVWREPSWFQFDRVDRRTSGCATCRIPMASTCPAATS